MWVSVRRSNGSVGTLTHAWAADARYERDVKLGRGMSEARLNRAWRSWGGLILVGCDCVGPDLEAFQRVQAECHADRDIRRIPPPRYQHSPDPGLQIPWIERMPRA